MRNLIGSTKYAPVGNTGENINPELNGITNPTKNNVLTGQVRRNIKIVNDFKILNPIKNY